MIVLQCYIGFYRTTSLINFKQISLPFFELLKHSNAVEIFKEGMLWSMFPKLFDDKILSWCYSSRGSYFGKHLLRNTDLKKL